MFDKTIEKIVSKQLQAMAEGDVQELTINGLLQGQVNASDDGTGNAYSSYESQVAATYAKYNGTATLGNWLTRTIIDTRTGFISGEGMSVATEDRALGEFFDKIMVYNRLKGSRFHNMVKAGEMEGRQLLTVTHKEGKDFKGKGNIKIVSKNSQYAGGINYKVYLEDSNDPTDIKKVTEILENGEERELKGEYIYVKLGGDPSKVNATTTRTGLILQEVDNYSRALNVMRKNNHLFARVTPFFKTATQKDATTLLAIIERLGWKVGSAFAGPAELKLVVPEVGAMENIQAELLSLTKAVTSVSGIPVHWFGYVDAMSNRAVADNLFEAINNATIQERSIWAETMYDVFTRAQEVAIDAGILKGSVNRDFEVKIPLISFAKSVELVKNLSLAFHDGAISMADYQNSLPGIDPIKTNMFIEAEKARGIIRNNDLVNEEQGTSRTINK